MSNFKSGAGNLDFGSGDKNDAEDEAAAGLAEDQSADQPVSTSSDTTSRTETSSGLSTSGQVASTLSADEYPYFVRRSNVGDERDTRLEIHVRDKVVEREAEFRNELAKQLGTSEVSKTDAREFALLDAFQNPKRVADRMREEGFGIID